MSESRTTLSGHDIDMLYDRSGLGAYHQRDSQVQVAYDRCILKFARYVEEMTIVKFKVDLSAHEGYTLEELTRGLTFFAQTPKLSFNMYGTYIDGARAWTAHDVIICAHAVLTSPTTVQRYELDDVDLETVARLRETLAVHSDGIDLLNVSDTVRSALELLINILDSGVAA